MMLPVPGTTLNCEPLLYGLLNCKPPLNGVNAWFELKFARHAIYCHKQVGQIYIASKYLHGCIVALCTFVIRYYCPMLLLMQNFENWIFSLSLY